jgi:Cys-tRNA(Pro)/Cys-tRNA(Cys) deacylase
VRGGISPFGHKSAIPVVADDSVLRFETMFVSGGKRGLQVEIAPADFLSMTKATLSTIAAS